MTHDDPKTATIHAYVAAFAAGNPAAATALFAANATLEDPVGSEVQRGSVAIGAFYARAMQTGARLALTGPICLAGDAAAFSFTVSVPAATIQIDVIDVFRFDPQGLVVSMQAFWGGTNVRPL
jgi:steroid delta-isomerase